MSRQLRLALHCLFCYPWHQPNDQLDIRLHGVTPHALSTTHSGRDIATMDLYTFHHTSRRPTYANATWDLVIILIFHIGLPKLFLSKFSACNSSLDWTRHGHYCHWDALTMFSKWSSWAVEWDSLYSQAWRKSDIVNDLVLVIYTTLQ